MMKVTIPTGSIVVGVDGTEHSLATVQWAVDLALAVGRPVTIVNVYRHDQALAEYAWAGSYTIDDAFAAAATIVREAVAPYLHLGTVTGLAINGDGWRPLVELSADAWLLVVGSHGHSLRHGILGSFAQKVVAHASCAAIVVPDVARRVAATVDAANERPATVAMAAG
jgi:nucleotide-binding universal stress UspA family protein